MEEQPEATSEEAATLMVLSSSISSRDELQSLVPDRIGAYDQPPINGRGDYHYAYRVLRVMLTYIRVLSQAMLTSIWVVIISSFLHFKRYLIAAKKMLALITKSQVRPSPFKIVPDVLKSIVRDKKDLEQFGGFQDIARDLCVNPEKGISAYDQPPISERRDYFGCNHCIVKSTGTSIAWIICCTFSTQGWLKVVLYMGLGIMLTVCVVITVPSILFMHYLNTERVSVTVHRNEKFISISTIDLVVGDIVRLGTGEKVPADGLYSKGRKILIREPSLTGVGEGAEVRIDKDSRHILRGSTVLSGYVEMMVTQDGKDTAWGQMIRRYEKWRLLSCSVKMLVLITKIQVSVFKLLTYARQF